MFEWRGTRSCRSSRWGELKPSQVVTGFHGDISSHPQKWFHHKSCWILQLGKWKIWKCSPKKRPGAQEDYLWKWQVERTMVLSTLAHPCICHLEGDWLKHQLQWLFGPFCWWSEATVLFVVQLQYTEVITNTPFLMINVDVLAKESEPQVPTIFTGQRGENSESSWCQAIWNWIHRRSIDSVLVCSGWWTFSLWFRSNDQCCLRCRAP